ncbi:MAG: tellurium resistance protein [Rhodobacteraceae bacterium]|nr:tellurium resistance protein [Paracoccaceae bacterium]
MKPFRPAPRPAFWSATPPAIFPPLLGLLGLGLAWRRGLAALGLPGDPAEMLLGGLTLLALFCYLAYATKLLRRPSVLIEEMRTLPGRAGLAAMTDSVMLLASVALPYGHGLATGVLWLGLGLHGGLALLMVRYFLGAPPPQRRVTPAWHLTFVGFIIGALAAVPLGLVLLAQVILIATVLAALAIWAVSLWQFARETVPAPLRPMLAIHLAPACLFTVVAAGLGWATLAAAFGAVAVAVALSLLAAARWITAAGFSPLWGAFTFPLTALASAGFALGTVGTGEAGRLLGVAALILATGAVPAIAYRVLQLWAKGQLGPRTASAVA